MRRENPVDTSERSMQMRLASHISWAKTEDRSARTEAARRASHHTRFMKQARELHPGASEAVIEAAAESLKSAFYTDLALKSKQARRAKSAAAKAAKKARSAQQLADAGHGSAAA